MSHLQVVKDLDLIRNLREAHQCAHCAFVMSKEYELALLKSHLGITPKTANLLHSSGYTTPRSLANSTPNEVVSKFGALPGMDMKKAKDYARPARRMVMLGAIEDAKEAATVVETCKVWSNKHLAKLGIWEDRFNDLTGIEILAKMRSVPSSRKR